MTPSLLSRLLPVLLLLSTFAAVCVAVEIVLIVRSATGDVAGYPVLIVCSLVLASAAVLVSFAAGALRGQRSNWIGIRIAAPIVVLAVIVLASIPGFLPDAVRLAQGIGGVLVLPVVIIGNLPGTAALFAR